MESCLGTSVAFAFAVAGTLDITAAFRNSSFMAA
jgi:hypothetical protein